MKRLCFLSPDIDRAKALVQALKSDGIEENHIYAIAKAAMPLDDLPDGGPDDDDFLPAFERGLAFGGSAGLFLGLVALVFPPAGIVVGGGAVLLIGLAGASVGGLLTGMAGAAFPNSRLKAFEKDIEDGKILIMADVPEGRVTHVNNLIQCLDQSIEVDGIEPAAPIIPK